MAAIARAQRKLQIPTTDSETGRSRRCASCAAPPAAPGPIRQIFATITLLASHTKDGCLRWHGADAEGFSRSGDACSAHPYIPRHVAMRPCTKCASSCCGRGRFRPKGGCLMKHPQSDLGRSEQLAICSEPAATLQVIFVTPSVMRSRPGGETAVTSLATLATAMAQLPRLLCSCPVWISQTI